MMSSADLPGPGLPSGRCRVGLDLEVRTEGDAAADHGPRMNTTAGAESSAGTDRRASANGQVGTEYRRLIDDSARVYATGRRPRREQLLGADALGDVLQGAGHGKSRRECSLRSARGGRVMKSSALRASTWPSAASNLYRADAAGRQVLSRKRAGPRVL